MSLRDDILARTELSQAVQERDCIAIAAAMSVGRVQVVSHLIGERGILDLLGAIDGDAFLAALESITEPALLPEPLRPYFGAIQRGVAWLKKDGLDIGSATTRSLLAALAAAGVLDAGSVAKIKGLAEKPCELTPRQVAEVIFNDDGSLK